MLLVFGVFLFVFWWVGIWDVFFVFVSVRVRLFRVLFEFVWIDGFDYFVYIVVFELFYCDVLFFEIDGLFLVFECFSRFGARFFSRFGFGLFCGFFGNFFCFFSCFFFCF